MVGDLSRAMPPMRLLRCNAINSAVISANALVWLAEVPFDGPPHRQQHLARLLALHYKVVFVEPPPPGRAPRMDVILRHGVRVTQVAPIANARPLRRLMSVPFGLRLARVVASLQVHRALAASGLWSRRNQLTVVCSNVFLIHAARSMRPRLLITDICDDPRFYPGEPPWTGEFLRRAVQAADIVTTSSRALEAEFVTLGARRLVYVPNGLHEGFLRATAQHRQKTNRPRVLGFVGHLGPWVDFDLLGRLAAQVPECILALVGSIAPACRGALEALLGYPNVRYTPAIPYADVPEVIAGFSVGLIPFRVSSYTRAVNPIKLYEYAALDLPVVSTAFSPDVAQFQPSIDVCATPEAFVQVSRERAAGHGRRPTRQIAEAHTWEQIACSFQALLSQRDVGTCRGP
jgi:glycosyltransferase involved in cell wall biosynthesis